MSIDITYKPHPNVWPKKVTANRKRSPFKWRWNEVMSDLERELRHLGAAKCSIALDLKFGEIRNDGQPRADARARTPGVILSFTAKRLPGEPAQVFPCDTFLTWQDNLVAIVRSLEKLRAVDRYGVTIAGEQYAGFKALPSGGESSAKMTPEQASDIIAEHSEIEAGGILAFPSVAKMAARAAQRRTHPDTGDHANGEAFALVQKATDILNEHHGGSLS